MIRGFTRTVAVVATVGAAVAVAVGAAGCASRGPGLTAPQATVAPYATNGSELLWAVAPLRNESGTTAADPAAVTDRLVEAVEDVRGVRAVPLNRTMQAMRALGLERIQSAAEARRLAQVMNVDAVLVGSVTAYDPYTPSLGLALALFARPGSDLAAGRSSVDPRRLQTMAVDPGASESGQFVEKPVAVVSELLDAKDHQVLMDMRSFGEGRSDATSALGWKRYAASMPLYTEFATHHAVQSLMRVEAIRMARVSGGAAGPRRESVANTSYNRE